jgi:uncharacterized protein involved in exopolysaccharide biosynthesis
LATHLEVYLESEIEKTLQILQAQGDFLSKQLSEAKAELSRIEGERTDMRQQYPELIARLLGEKAPLPGQKVGSARDSMATGLQSTREKIALLEKRLQEGDSLLVDRVKAAERYTTEISETQVKLAQAKSSGLTDQHPEVRRLTARIAQLEQLARATVNADSTDVQKRTNEEYRAMKEEIEQLKRTEAAERHQLETLIKDYRVEKDKAKDKALSLAQLEALYIELERDLNSAGILYEAILAKKQANDLQLEMERAAANTRYDILTPPTAIPPDAQKAILMGAGLGGAVGLILAVLIAGWLELRRFVKRADVGRSATFTS